MVNIGTRPHVLPKHQPDAVIDQDNPVSGTKYPVCDVKNARILSLYTKIIWSVQPSSLELHTTVDGVLHTYTIANPLSDKGYYGSRPYESDPIMSLVYIEFVGARAYLFEGRSVKIELEVTGGTVSNLSARMKWAQW